LSSLSNRIFLASAVVAVLSIATAVFLVNFAVTRRAEVELERSVTEAAELVAQFQTLLFEHLVREARLVADLPRLKAAVYDDHAPTAQAVAEEYARQIEADLFLVTNRSGRLLAAIGDPGVPSDAVASRQGVREALVGRPVVGFWPRADGLLPVVSTPIVIGPGQPEILGTVSVGVGLSPRLAVRIKGLTRSEVVFMADGRVQGSTLSAEHHAALAAAFAAPGASRIVLGGEEYQAAWRPLTLAVRAGAPPSASLPAEAIDMDARGGSRTPTIIALRSRTAELAFLRTLHTAFGLTALGAVLLATLLSYAIARTTTRPIRALTATMGEIASTGELTPTPRAPAPTPWEDEDARLLTGAFHTLTASLARFQREAAQRERLSSLGRLSTVVAHEIRNPLTIIKASLRTLRRGTRPEDTGALHAIADIEGEVNRLNRVVHDVLDYARPIRFAIERVEAGRLVHDAANAVLASQPGPAIRVEVPPDPIELETDGDRLRQALVNVLSNARDAVVERERSDSGRAGAAPEDGGAAAPPVVVTTTADEAAVHIVVRDAGIGIAAAELSRIFEPFFTTKKAGSGIGLAITKNVIEGLGGSIGVASDPRRGTTVRLTIPRVPAVARDTVAVASERSMA
jgi:signal transduction histidine kinase